MIAKILAALKRLFARDATPPEPEWISLDEFQAAMGISEAAAHVWYPFVREAALEYGIDTPQRIAAFLAQVGHETVGLRYVREIWGPTAAQERYEGRTDLGNTQPGDGRRYLGRGLLHTTGRANYRSVTKRLRTRLGDDVPDFEQSPTLLEQPRWAAMSAGDYWEMRSINAAADAGDFERVTRLVNGGLNGYTDRVARHHTAQDALA